MRRGRAALLALVCGGALPLSACCGDSARAAIVLRIVDARTGSPAATGATVVVEGGAGFRDSVTIAADPPAGFPPYFATGPGARGGRYTVRVRRPGYREWTRTVAVGSGMCGKPETEALTASLEPSAVAALAPGR